MSASGASHYSKDNWFSTNFERFGAYLAALMLNFPKHTNFFPFLMDFRGVMAIVSEITLFFTHPVDVMLLW